MLFVKYEKYFPGKKSGQSPRPQRQWALSIKVISPFLSSCPVTRFVVIFFCIYIKIFCEAVLYQCFSSVFSKGMGCRNVDSRIEVK